MPLLLMKLVFNKTTRAPVPFFIRPITGAVAAQVGKAYLDPALEGHLRYADQALADGPWFAGPDLSGADIQMSFVVEGANARAGLGDRYPRLADFLARIRARPAWKRALERGGPYQLGAF
jgi:glutathione S-transferase